MEINSCVVNIANSKLVTLIDSEDYGRIMAVSKKWYYHKNKGYVFCPIKKNGKRETVMLHRLIMETPNGKHTDHINGNKFDNRKCNLRACTPSQNRQNRQWSKRAGDSEFFGVHKKGTGFWSAIFVFGKIRYYLGIYETEYDAARAYNIKIKEIYGDNAKFNEVPNPFKVPTRIIVNKRLNYGIYYRNVDNSWSVRFLRNGKWIYGGYYKNVGQAREIRDEILKFMEGGIDPQEAAKMARKNFKQNNVELAVINKLGVHNLNLKYLNQSP